MKPHLVQLTRHEMAEVTVEVYADNGVEAERLAKDLMPPSGRDWVVVNCEVTAVVET